MSRSGDLFRTRLKAYMASVNWGPQDLADATGIARSAVQRWLKSEDPGDPSLEGIERVAALMKSSVSALLDAEREPVTSRVPPDILQVLEQCNEDQFNGIRALLIGSAKVSQKLALAQVGKPRRDLAKGDKNPRK